MLHGENCSSPLPPLTPDPKSQRDTADKWELLIAGKSLFRLFQRNKQVWFFFIAQLLVPVKETSAHHFDGEAFLKVTSTQHSKPCPMAVLRLGYMRQQGCPVLGISAFCTGQESCSSRAGCCAQPQPPRAALQAPGTDPAPCSECNFSYPETPPHSAAAAPLGDREDLKCLMTQAQAAEQYLLCEITTALFFTAAEGGQARRSRHQL